MVDYASSKLIATILADCPNSKLIAIIDDRIKSERDRAIIKRRLCDGICYEQIAEEVGMSTRQIKNIVCRAQKKIIKYI